MCMILTGVDCSALSRLFQHSVAGLQDSYKALRGENTGVDGRALYR